MIAKTPQHLERTIDTRKRELWLMVSIFVGLLTVATAADENPKLRRKQSDRRLSNKSQHEQEDVLFWNRLLQETVSSFVEEPSPEPTAIPVTLQPTPDPVDPPIDPPPPPPSTLAPVAQPSQATPSPTSCVPSTQSPTAESSPLDLSGWVADGDGNWVVAEDRNSVIQTRNLPPGFFCSDFEAFGNELSGEIAVLTRNDDDYIGFALGYTPGDLTNDDADYLLIDWKQGDQTFAGEFAAKGFAVSRVSGVVGRIQGFWAHNEIDELARGNSLGDIGWNDNEEYAFRFVYTTTELQVYVNDVLEIELFGEDFPNGNFCFYNYSQQTVRYSGLTRTVLPSSPPAKCQ